MVLPGNGVTIIPPKSVWIFRNDFWSDFEERSDDPFLKPIVRVIVWLIFGFDIVVVVDFV